jgi:hypothetical protein
MKEVAPESYEKAMRLKAAGLLMIVDAGTEMAAATIGES